MSTFHIPNTHTSIHFRQPSHIPRNNFRLHKRNKRQPSSTSKFGRRTFSDIIDGIIESF